MLWFALWLTLLSNVGRISEIEDEATKHDLVGVAFIAEAVLPFVAIGSLVGKGRRGLWMGLLVTPIIALCFYVQFLGLVG
jgi:hypothetical protein